MAEIELVIKVPESIWVAIQNGEYCGILDDRTYDAIKNGTPLTPDMLKENNPKADKNSIVGVIVHGTPLPKGHGRLIDADKLTRGNKLHLWYHLPNGDIACPKIDIDNAPTIIPADKEEV